MAEKVSHSLLDSAAPLMKRFYDTRRVKRHVYENHPLFAWIPKRTGVSGEDGGYNVPIQIGDTPGESSDFASAVAARDGTSSRVWQLKRTKRYSTATIDWETVRAMKNDTGAFMRAIVPTIDSAQRTFGRSLAWGLYQDGTGVRGVVASVSGNVVTLTNASDVRAFGLRRMLDVGTTATGATKGEYPRVTARDPQAGTITVDNIGTIAATDFLFVRGDAANGGTQKMFDGLGAWLPDPATITGASPDFKGVARADDKSRLLGLHYDGQGVAIDAALRNAAATIHDNEGMPSVCFMNPLKRAALETILENRVQYDKVVSDDGTIGFDAIKVSTSVGPIKVVSDSWCPLNTAYMLQKDSWELFSIDNLPDFVSADGNRLHRLENADEVEFRLGGYFNLACRAPGMNIVITDIGVP